jgi:phospholipid N-methyltransferase
LRLDSDRIEGLSVSRSNPTIPAAAGEVIEPRSAEVGDLALFFRKFLEKGREISSAVPSSRTMALRMLAQVDFDRPGTIIELGAGTGAITEHIVERLRPHHRFVAVERDPDFVAILRRRFPPDMILQADATRLPEPLARIGVHKAHYLLCCLPTPALTKRGIVRFRRWVADTLEPGGLFLQLTIVPLLYRRFYRRLFEQVSFGPVWRNFPPGGIYTCRSPRLRAGDANGG